MQTYLYAAILLLCFCCFGFTGKIYTDHFGLYETLQVEYALEYGTDTVEMHSDAIQSGQNVLLVDDLLATGGTMEAACQLIEKAGGNIAGIGFLIELDFLNGRSKLEKYNVQSLVHYDS